MSTLHCQCLSWATPHIQAPFLRMLNRQQVFYFLDKYRGSYTMSIHSAGADILQINKLWLDYVIV